MQLLEISNENYDYKFITVYICFAYSMANTRKKTDRREYWRQRRANTTDDQRQAYNER